MDVYFLLSFTFVWSQFNSSDFPEALSTSPHRKNKGKKNIWEIKKKSIVGNKSFSRTCLQHLSLLFCSSPPSLQAKRGTCYHSHCVSDKANQVKSAQAVKQGGFHTEKWSQELLPSSSKVASRSRVVTWSWVWCVFQCRGLLRKVAFLLNSCIISQHVLHAHRVSKRGSVGNKMMFVWQKYSLYGFRKERVLLLP